MNAAKKTTRKQVCAVLFRFAEDQTDFCLVAHDGDSRWCFPKGLMCEGESPAETALRLATDGTGLECHVMGEQPLDVFGASRGDDADTVTAMLVCVDDSHEDRVSSGVRRRWCLPEEARVRIRRKPIRRLVDTALRWLGEHIKRTQ